MLSVALVVVVASWIPAALPCATDPQFQYGIVETMKKTDYIVYGQYKGENSITGHGMFMVFCIFTANGADMPENITIQLDSTSCSPTKMTNGTDYIVMLKTLNMPDRDTFRLAEPSQDSSAAFLSTEENLRLAVNLCGLNADTINMPTDATQTAKKCPKRTATEAAEDCVSEDPPTSRAASGYGSGHVLLYLTAMMTMTMRGIV